jgi:transcriptional regulator with XRE-family HTH domain
MSSVYPELRVLQCAYGHIMDFGKLREALRSARERVATERDGRARIGLTLDEAAAASGLNRATIHAIENIRREPQLKPELETIERLTSAYGLTLAAFFAQIDDTPVKRTVGAQLHLSPSERELVELWRHADHLPHETKEHIRGMLRGRQAKKRQQTA